MIKLHAPQAGTLTETHVEEGRRVAPRRSSVRALHRAFVPGGARVASRGDRAIAGTPREPRPAKSNNRRRWPCSSSRTWNSAMRDMAQRDLAVERGRRHARRAPGTAAARRWSATRRWHARASFPEAQLVQQREQVLEQQARLQALERSRTALQRDRGSLAAAQAAQRPKSARERALPSSARFRRSTSKSRNTNRAARS